MREQRRPVWEWDRLEQHEFDRTVELLLYLKYSAIARVVPLDGRGGDGGIDVFMVNADGHRTIFQLKYFPEGFSGKHKDRREQIKRSLASALKHNPDEWVLVWPSVPHKSDNAFISDLRADNASLTITPWGRTKLDALLVEFPDVINVMRRGEAAIELLTQLREESAALTGGMTDVAQRVAGLKDVIDGSDPHWTLDIATQGKTIIQTLRAKHPQAPEVSPIKVAFTADLDDDEHAELRATLRRSLDYGVAGEVTLPASTVKNFHIDGPPLVHREPTDGVQVTWCAPVNTAVEGASIKLVLSDSDGRLVATHIGRALHGGAGGAGASLQVLFHDTVSLTYLLPPQEGGTCRMDLSYDTGGANGDPTRVRKATQLVLDLKASTQMDVSFNGTRFFHAKAAHTFGRADTDDWTEHLRDLNGLAVDLESIGRDISADLTIPASMSTQERIWLRCVRLMLEGHVVMSPNVTSFDVTLENADDPGLRKLLDQPAGQLILTQEPWNPTIADMELNLPDARFWHPNVGVSDREQVAERLRAGEQVSTTIATLDGTTFRLLMPERLKNCGEPLNPVAWGLRDIPEKLPKELDALGS